MSLSMTCLRKSMTCLENVYMLKKIIDMLMNIYGLICIWAICTYLYIYIYIWICMERDVCFYFPTCPCGLYPHMACITIWDTSPWPMCQCDLYSHMGYKYIYIYICIECINIEVQYRETEGEKEMASLWPISPIALYILAKSPYGLYPHMAKYPHMGIKYIL